MTERLSRAMLARRKTECAYRDVTLEGVQVPLYVRFDVTCVCSLSILSGLIHQNRTWVAGYRHNAPVCASLSELPRDYSVTL